jgi:heat shock protein HslJ
MKKSFFTAVLITIILMSGFAQPSGITELTGKSWQLTEVRINGVNTGFNRNDLSRTGLEGFALTFGTETLSGLGAPNRYVAPYSQTGNQISISLISSTKMALFFEPDKLNEQEYFIYLQNAGSWDLVNNNLELTSKTADDKTVILVFNPVYPNDKN